MRANGLSNSYKLLQIEAKVLKSTYVLRRNIKYIVSKLKIEPQFGEIRID